MQPLPFRYALALLACLGLGLSLLAQPDINSADRFRVSFRDKAGTPYSVLRPHDFLSPRALERRQRYGIGIEESDLPVSPAYLQALRDKGARVLVVSKWLNSAVIQIEPARIGDIGALPFVSATAPVGKTHSKLYQADKPNKPIPREKDYKRQDNYYGYGEGQITMLGGELLHLMGWRGEGMLVAVLDGGFSNVDVMPFFDSLRADGRLLDGYDLVEGDRFPYESSSHGTQVLSTMGAELPGLLVGTAPDASYVCIKTEDTNSETLIEEENWIAGLELADSLGADVINSSLGYTSFDFEEMNYRYEQLDGQQSRASRAADIAYAKGMIVVNSAGNSGGDAWNYIGVPADSRTIFSIAAVMRSGARAYFSSYGPTPDGRIKPNVAAQGMNTTVASLSDYKTTGANGTSFSSPVTAGMVSALWQGVRELDNDAVLAAIEANGSQADAPDPSLGFGIPNYFSAFFQLRQQAGWQVLEMSGLLGLYGGREGRWEFLGLNPGPGAETLELSVLNPLGQDLLRSRHALPPGLQRFDLANWPPLPQGAYVLRVRKGEEVAYLPFGVGPEGENPERP